MVENMDKNHAFLEYLNQNKNLNKEDVLKLFKNKYLNYEKLDKEC